MNLFTYNTPSLSLYQKDFCLISIFTIKFPSVCNFPATG